MNLNKQPKCKTWPITETNKMLQNIEGFQYAIPLDISIGITTYELARMWIIYVSFITLGSILVQRTYYEGKQPPRYFPIERIKFQGFTYVPTYIDNIILIITVNNHLRSTLPDGRNSPLKIENIAGKITIWYPVLYFQYFSVWF